MDQVSPRRRARRRGAYTLVEVTIALGILATGLLAVGAAQLHAMRGGARGRHASEAAAIAHSQIEEFQRVNFDDLADTGGAWASESRATTIQTPEGDLVEMEYTLSWRIADVDDALKQVDLRVTWDEPLRPNRSVTLSTLIHDDPFTGG